jgi:hypothetical protein
MTERISVGEEDTEIHQREEGNDMSLNNHKHGIHCNNEVNFIEILGFLFLLERLHQYREIQPNLVFRKEKNVML